MADPHLVDGNWWRHEPWAVELRRAAADNLRTPVPLRDAIEQALVEISSGPDCSECFDEWANVLSPALPYPEVEDILALAATDGAYAAINELRAWQSRMMGP